MGHGQSLAASPLTMLSCNPRSCPHRSRHRALQRNGTVLSFVLATPSPLPSARRPTSISAGLLALSAPRSGASSSFPPPFSTWPRHTMCVAASSVSSMPSNHITDAMGFLWQIKRRTSDSRCLSAKRLNYTCCLSPSSPMAFRFSCTVQLLSYSLPRLHCSTARAPVHAAKSCRPQYLSALVHHP